MHFTNNQAFIRFLQFRSLEMNVNGTAHIIVNEPVNRQIKNFRFF
jgi:hypothetical protein